MVPVGLTNRGNFRATSAQLGWSCPIYPCNSKLPQLLVQLSPNQAEVAPNGATLDSIKLKLPRLGQLARRSCPGPIKSSQLPASSIPSHQPHLALNQEPKSATRPIQFNADTTIASQLSLSRLDLIYCALL